MDRLFLDANVLFSAAYRDEAGLLRLWDLTGVRLITSAYALEEARRNLLLAAQRERLEGLAAGLQVVGTVTPHPAMERIGLAQKDWPILSAAIRAGATHLLTGDARHFGPWFGERLEGVLILLPAAYLRSRER